MHFSSSLLSISAIVTSLAPISSAETVLGAYIFSRHGDRTSKSTPPTILTELGYRQVYLTGSYYHDRYISSSASSQILNISPDLISPGQVTASAPHDEVLQKSATAFFQGLYPPAGNRATMTLRNGTVIEGPMDGYQLIAIEQVKSGTNSENVGWLQGASNCHNAKVSSNKYFSSDHYNELFESTSDFYKSLAPMLNRTFAPEKISYRNAYMIFDLLNVASIQNASDAFHSSALLTDSTYSRLQQLANTYEFNLAYSPSEPIRAISGALLAGEVLNSFKETIQSHTTKPKLNVQFGAYASFLSFFGLAKLPAANVDFTGIPDYASTMAFELVTNASASDSFPGVEDISVRFLFHNGTIIPGSSDTEPTIYPLFDQGKPLLPWVEFVSHMEKISITSQDAWCKACGGSNPECSASSIEGNSSTVAGTNSDGMSKVVAGVVGALVTLAVVFGVQLAAYFLGGFRITRKLAGGPEAEKVSV
ncbi:hypothetical protein FQN57_004446 [Myotisia sp. PD_48]|nr:hypothetical protein FQN57_004446 [Myotisia sp. PD_48]